MVEVRAGGRVCALGFPRTDTFGQPGGGQTAGVPNPSQGQHSTAQAGQTRPLQRPPASFPRQLQVEYRVAKADADGADGARGEEQRGQGGGGGNDRMTVERKEGD